MAFLKKTNVIVDKGNKSNKVSRSKMDCGHILLGIG